MKKILLYLAITIGSTYAMGFIAHIEQTILTAGEVHWYVKTTLILVGVFGFFGMVISGYVVGCLIAKKIINEIK